MIGWLQGKVVDKADNAIILNVQGVGYEVFCATSTVENLDSGSDCSLYIYTHYKSDGGATLFGFLNRTEKELFLNLIKVDSVGPKSALNILSAGPWDETIHFIEEGDVTALAGLPKISKKTAEHVVVKLKGKLSELILESAAAGSTAPARVSSIRTAHALRGQAQTALQHLGYKNFEVEKALDQLNDDIWKQDLEVVIRAALNDLSGT